MELSKQVTSLEISKKLNDLWVKKDSIYVWVLFLTGREKEWQLRHTPTQDTYNFRDSRISAFTVAELWELMKTENMSSWYSEEWCGWWAECLNVYGKVREEDTEANARWLLLIYLIENKLISL